jgi:hypothetical protein
MVEFWKFRLDKLLTENGYDSDFRKMCSRLSKNAIDYRKVSDEARATASRKFAKIVDTIVVPLYTAATTYDDLMALNILFMRGDLPATPYHDAPLCDDSEKEFKELVDLALYYKIVSFDGQAGECSERTRDRAYLNFMFDPKVLDKNRMVEEFRRRKLFFVMGSDDSFETNCLDAPVEVDRNGIFLEDPPPNATFVYPGGYVGYDDDDGNPIYDEKEVLFPLQLSKEPLGWEFGISFGVSKQSLMRPVLFSYTAAWPEIYKNLVTVILTTEKYCELNLPKILLEICGTSSIS